MNTFKTVEFYSTGRKVEVFIEAENCAQACIKSHKKILKNRAYLKTIMVYNEYGHVAMAWSRANGLNNLNQYSIQNLLDLYTYGHELVCGEICEDALEGSTIMIAVKNELDNRINK